MTFQIMTDSTSDLSQYYLKKNHIEILGMTVTVGNQTYETIGEAIGKTKNTVMKYVHGLEEKHLIYTEPTTVWGEGGLKRNGNLRFTIRPIEEAKRFHVEQQMRENERKKLEEQVA